MSNLSAFLNPLPAEEKEVFISDRFIQRGENGEPILGPDGKPLVQMFKIRPLTQAENANISKQCTRSFKKNGQMQEYVDSDLFTRRLVVAATVDPNFSSTEVCQHFGVSDPAIVPSLMLFSGEFTTLLKAIMELSGFSDDVEDEAKN